MPTRKEEIEWARVCREKKEQEAEDELEQAKKQRYEEYESHRPLLSDTFMEIYDKLIWLHEQIIETIENAKSI